jgi:hypothetical protein
MRRFFLSGVLVCFAAYPAVAGNSSGDNQNKTESDKPHPCKDHRFDQRLDFLGNSSKDDGRGGEGKDDDCDHRPPVSPHKPGDDHDGHGDHH